MIDDEERGLASRKLRSGLIVASFAPVRGRFTWRAVGRA